MTFTHFTLAFLAPAMAHAAAFAWTTPEPTPNIPAIDSWSPTEPTAAPQLPLHLFRREQQSGHGSNICGFVSGASASAITCPSPTFVCATNAYFAVNGCCDPASLSSCIIPTACIASSALSTACADTACSTDAAIKKCSESSAPNCYEWHFIQDKKTVIQHGCADTAFTSTALGTGGTSETDTVTLTVTADPVTTPTSTSSSSSSSTSVVPPSSSGSSKPGIGAIVGGTIGACTFVSFIAFIVFLAWRRRRAATQDASTTYTQSPHPHPHHSMVEYNPVGFPSPSFSSPVSPDLKVWSQHHFEPGVVGDAAPLYPSMGSGHVGIVEVDGSQRPVEAPAGTAAEK
ncbi:hypothetical protein BDW02DRAFT_569725 [Decorospora gaudefroyi]|uniref:Mid2 domain-containing protein n=1 Tax=Decorospora gaudefroyi TaxID=184978 RepID=A0A6A5KJW4_9PLEO|nr:hypothetical protein BDW02DRAFT_569725 [Decorospora gaudefroyi]